MSEDKLERRARIERELRTGITQLIAARFKTYRIEFVRQYIDAGTILVHYKDDIQPEEMAYADPQGKERAAPAA
jgi:hypothetical protein